MLLPAKKAAADAAAKKAAAPAAAVPVACCGVVLVYAGWLATLNCNKFTTGI